MRTLSVLTIVVCASASCSVSTGKAPASVRGETDAASDNPWGDANPGPGGGEFSDGTDMNCGGQAFAISRVPPNVMLVLDRSQSMARTISRNIRNGPTKWDDLKAAIKAVIAQFDTTIRFGADLFSEPGTTMCVPGTIAVALGDKTGASIQAAIDATSPGGETPTAATLDNVIQQGLLNDAGRENFVVLATDGEPNCTDVDVGTRIDTLYHQTPSVKTYVIGVGDGTAANPALLNSWAVAGHTNLAGATKYYQANSPADLIDAFNAIAGGVVSCTFKLEKQPPDENQLYVWINGQRVAADSVNGWTFEGTGPTVTLHGTACDQVKQNPGTKVQLIYGCPEPPIS